MNLLKSCAGLLLFFTNLLFAQQGLINVNPYRNIAIHGYDPVAYFTQAKAVEGKDKYQHDHEGVIWQFSSQENLNLFIGNPVKYIPQYGGFCAYAASQGAKADVDPIAWRIIDGKLYLNYDLRVQRVWASDLNENINAANQYWLSIQH